MNMNGQHIDQEEFRIVLVLPWSGLVLASDDGFVFRIPRLSVPRRSRLAQRLCEAVEARWHIKTFLIDLLAPSEHLPPCAVMEVRSHERTFDTLGLAPALVDDFDKQELTTLERFVVSKIIVGDTQERGPFSKLGWINEAQSWVQSCVSNRNLHLNEDIRQLNASGCCALVRFGTTEGPAYWLKAASAQSAHEWMVTQTIARCCPEFVPQLIDVRSDWKAWLMEDAGQPLNATNLNAFTQATHALAQMQIASSPHTDVLLRGGCFDQHLSNLRASIPGLVNYLTAAMAKQTSTKVACLNSRRLREIGRLLQEACTSISAIGIPETLLHNDINAGNILFLNGRVLFTDWSEALIGTPFLTFQHLRVQASEAGYTQICVSKLKNIYTDYWRRFLTVSQIETALSLTTPLAIASYLCGRDPTFESPLRADDTVQVYARSLARYMDRLIHSQEFMEALCR